MERRRSGAAARTDLRAARASLPDELGSAVDRFQRHLAAERGLSRHTVRAYLGDVVSLLADVANSGPGLDQVTLPALRSWLAGQHAQGISRATLARRAASVRTFTAWAHRTGLLAADPGPRLTAPSKHRVLPSVLRADQADSAMTASAAGAAQGDPVALRDHALLELLYATGIGWPSCAGSTSTTSIMNGACSAYSVRASGSAPCRSAYPPMRHWNAGSRRDGPNSAPTVPAPRSSSVHAAGGWTSAWHAGWCTTPCRPCPARPISGRTG